MTAFTLGLAPQWPSVVDALLVLPLAAVLGLAIGMVRPMSGRAHFDLTVGARDSMKLRPQVEHVLRRRRK